MGKVTDVGWTPQQTRKLIEPDRTGNDMSPRTDDEITVAQWIAYLEDTVEKLRMGMQETTPRHRFALNALIDDIDKAAARLRTGGVLH